MSFAIAFKHASGRARTCRSTFAHVADARGHAGRVYSGLARCNPLSGVAKDEGRTWEGENHSHLARPDLRRFERPAPSAVYSSRSGLRLARRRGAARPPVCAWLTRALKGLR